MNVTAAISMLVVVSIYDIYMVHGSKKMVYLAKKQLSNNLFSGLMVGKIDESKHMDETPTQVTKLHKAEKSSSSFAAVGGGDIAFPLLFAGAAMKASGTILIGYSIAIGATIGLLILFLTTKKDSFHPAMPYVSGGAILNWIITTLLIRKC
jgi:presenilin-like A22 family membrane protease